VDDFGRSIGDAISGALSRAVDAVGAAFDGLIASFGSLPGGWLWLVGAVVLVVVAWRVVR
jgi:hypothetical protein